MYSLVEGNRTIMDVVAAFTWKGKTDQLRAVSFTGIFSDSKNILLWCQS